jgi:phospholipid-binding lipoprotein MlaA
MIENLMSVAMLFGHVQPVDGLRPPAPEMVGTADCQRTQMAAQREVNMPLVEPIPSALAPAPATVPPGDQASASNVAAQQPSEMEAAEEDIVVMARRGSPADPLQRVNLQSYKAVQALDGAVVAPVAKAYRRIPKPLRDGVHNFLDNVQVPVVFLNYLLQLKPGKAIETLGRFATNTTVGLGGVVDIARRRPFNLPHRPNSLANTLGYYGVKPGPYLFLPLVGPTTVRDLIGISVDRLVVPTVLGAPFNKPYHTVPTNVLSALDYRVAADEQLKSLHAASDPHTATRAAYLQKRDAEIRALHSPSWNARHPAPVLVLFPANLSPVPPKSGSTPVASGICR